MKLRTNPVLLNAMRAVLYTGIATTVAVSMPVFAAEEDANEVEEEVIVTGSRIQRSELAQSSDVVTLGEAEIEATGDLMIADVLRSSPLNTYGSFNERSGNSAQSNATVDLRGLGSERTLVLVNGRRIPGSPNLGAASVNINMIPMAAVERIDLLPNSASAVYGSDAVAGVVNIILKKNFEGFEITARHGERSEDDGIEEGASLVGGASNDKGNVTYAVEWNRRDPIFDADRDYTAPWMTDFNGDGTIDIYDETDGISFYGKSVALWDYSGSLATPFDQLRSATDCPTDGGFVGELGMDGSQWGTVEDHTVCGYAYAGVSANKASLNRINTYIDTNYELSDNVEFFASAIFSRVESFGRYAPPAAAWPDMPADYPTNPFDIDALLANGSITEDYTLRGYYRWTNVGLRDDTVTDTQYDITGGFRGDITDTLSYEVYAQYNRYDSDTVGTYYLSYPGLDTVLNNGIDPFSPEGAGMMRATTSQNNMSDMTKYYGQLQWTAGDWFGAGDAIVLGGMEYFENDYVNLFDAASEAGLVGGSAGNSSAGDRDVTAFFAETIIPLPMDFELDAAIRYDDYSDFGDNWSPALGLTWQAMDNVGLRANWGQGFRAPALSDLYGPVTFSAEYATDYTSCFELGIAPEDCSERQYDTYITSNSDLDAETSDSWSLGGNWEFYDGWTVDLSYWNIQIDDVISFQDTQSVLYAEAAGVQLDPATGIWVDREGATTVYTTTTNSGELNTDGFDFQLRGLVDTSYGMWAPGFLASYTNSYEQQVYYEGPVQETSGFNFQPEWRWQFMLNWNLGRHYVDMTVDYIGEHSEADFIVINPDTGSAKLETSNKNLDSWTTLNASYKYDTEKWGAFKLGARNLTNEDPILNADDKYEGDHPDLYDNTGRVIYVEYSLKY